MAEAEEAEEGNATKARQCEGQERADAGKSKPRWQHLIGHLRHREKLVAGAR